MPTNPLLLSQSILHCVSVFRFTGAGMDADSTFH
jgi:hypothetical protein